MSVLHRRLDRLDGGRSHGNVRDMSDAQLHRIIMQPMPPAQLAKYKAATPEELGALLERIAGGTTQ